MVVVGVNVVVVAGVVAVAAVVGVIVVLSFFPSLSFFFPFLVLLPQLRNADEGSPTNGVSTSVPAPSGVGREPRVDLERARHRALAI